MGIIHLDSWLLLLVSLQYTQFHQNNQASPPAITLNIASTYSRLLAKRGTLFCPPNSSRFDNF